MSDDGAFGQEIVDSAGVYVRCDDVRVVEFVAFREAARHNGADGEEVRDGQD
jgi:hypothetical protein